MCPANELTSIIPQTVSTVGVLAVLPSSRDLPKLVPRTHRRQMPPTTATNFCAQAAEIVHVAFATLVRNGQSRQQLQAKRLLLDDNR